jgi:hypothetical protein
MADCHDLFGKFHEKVAVSSARKAQLRTSRNATRERIKRHFSEVMKVSPPTFDGQGSYSMNTLVNPIDRRYDIDDGVYLQHLGADRSAWPTTATVHGWLIDATKDSTDEPPQDRDRCVRVIYKATPPYHIDLPAYVMENDAPQLFDKSRENAKEAPVSPYESDPAAMTDWFCGKVDDDDQLRRLVRYTKGWKDFKFNQGTAVAKGLMLATLLAETFVTDDRDDVALSKTIDAANARMKLSTVVRKPVTPFEDMTAGWTKEQREDFLERLQQFRDLASDAVAEKDKAKAAKIWQKLFGDRFPDAEPEPEKKTESAQKTAAPAIIGRDGRSA